MPDEASSRAEAGCANRIALHAKISRRLLNGPTCLNGLAFVQDVVGVELERGCYSCSHSVSSVSFVIVSPNW